MGYWVMGADLDPLSQLTADLGQVNYLNPCLNPADASKTPED